MWLLPLPHMIRRVHVDKGRSVLSCCLTTSTHLREALALALLERSLLPLDSLGAVVVIESVSSLTFDSRVSVSTLQTSSCFVTSHGRLPSQSSTRETGLEARSLANSAGGSAPAARANGKFGGSTMSSESAQIFSIEMKNLAYVLP